MQTFACGCEWLAATLSPEGIILNLSSGAEQITGYSAQELTGRHLSRILDDSSALEYPRIMDSMKEWGYWEGDLSHLSRDGKSMEARSILSLLAGAGNSSAGYLLISNLKRSMAPQDVDHSAMTEIAGNLRTYIHDLNNPMAIIMGFAQLLMMDKNVPGKTRADVEKMYSELRRVIQVIEKLRSYAMTFYDKQENQSITA
jgi:PAS domain S-box-containing protein